MAGDEEPTTGHVAWFLAMPTVAVAVGVPTAVLTPLFVGVVATLDLFVPVPTVTPGVLPALGLPATLAGVPVVYGLVPALLASVGLFALSDGVTREDDDEGPRRRAPRR